MTIIRVRVPAELHGESLEQLRAALVSATDASGDVDRRVIVLEGEGEVFSRGMRLGAAGVANANDAMATFQACLTAIRFSRRPVIAVVDGQALAGGVGLAAACDVIVATDRATFALSEVLFGLAPMAIFPVLLERMSAQKARLMALSGRAYTALEAQAIGLVDAVVEPADLDRAIKQWARLLGRGESGAIRELKKFSAEASRMGLVEAIERGGALTLDALARPEVRARIEAFESGDPAWGTT